MAPDDLLAANEFPPERTKPSRRRPGRAAEALMRLWLAQCNTTVGDIEGNLATLARACARARAAAADVVVTPELAVVGYPPLDLLDQPATIAASEATIPRLAAMSGGLTLIVGSIAAAPEGSRRPAHNVAHVFVDGTLTATVAKRLLPTYDVFDEDRYFQPGAGSPILHVGGRRVGVTICEDIWSEDEDGLPRYPIDPVSDLVAAGADCIINLSASPFDLGKAERRLRLLRRLATQHQVPVAYCNLVGGNDALIFDGRSVVVDAGGAVLALGAPFAADDVLVRLGGPEATPPMLAPLEAPPRSWSPPPAEEARSALALGLRDYARKCGFSQVLLGLSGGIDSALTAAIAVEALGAEAVLGVAMPGPHSSTHSVADALQLAAALGIRCPVIPISPICDAFVTALGGELRHPGRDQAGVTLQNLQARARGSVLMALSNHTGRLLLTTGNKSELAVGYCTLYGDMNGGLAVIGDLPKMLVYEVARTYNAAAEVIPASTLAKPPSAELAPDQRDDDTLPPYPVLDAILERYLIDRLDVRGVAAATGADEALVRRIVRMVEANEYKRRQAAPVLRVTRKAFGGGRRMPIARRLPPG